jgi:hypothetical protein
MGECFLLSLLVAWPKLTILPQITKFDEQREAGAFPASLEP